MTYIVSIILVKLKLWMDIGKYLGSRYIYYILHDYINEYSPVVLLTSCIGGFLFVKHIITL